MGGPQLMAQESPIVDTTAGKVQGFINDGVHTFMGIPFAASTGGARRYLPPIPPESWEGVRPCVEAGPVAPQAESVSFDRYAVPGLKSEDCLNLNVWTPSVVGDEPLPVLVFFHGGGYTGGSGSVSVYDCTRLAQRGVVCVTINYRLAQLGFLYLDELFPDLESTANLGLLDARRSLEWIAENIAGFGGDPSKVTISGSSAGGGVVIHLMGMPSARPLFHRAIPLSIGGRNSRGVLNTTAARRSATLTALTLLDRFGVKPGDTDALRAIPMEKLVPQGGVYELFAGTGVAPRTSPLAGDPTLPIPPRDAVANGDAAGIDLMTGHTQEEYGGRRTTVHSAHDALAMRYVPMPRPDADAELDLREFFAHSSLPIDEIRSRYAAALARDGRPNDDIDIYMAALSDSSMALNAAVLAETHGVKHPNSYLFKFRWPSPVFDGALGSFHGVMTPFFFDRIDHAAWADVMGPEAPQELASQLVESALAFVETGNPNNESIPYWPSVAEGGRPQMIFDVPTELAFNSDGERLALLGA
jgi:para-nitrobenzyl esterase